MPSDSQIRGSGAVMDRPPADEALSEPVEEQSLDEEPQFSALEAQSAAAGDSRKPPAVYAPEPPPPPKNAKEVMERVDRVMSWLLEWRHAARAMKAAAVDGHVTASFKHSVYSATRLAEQWCPADGASYLMWSEESATRAVQLVGSHVERLAQKLSAAEVLWPAHKPFRGDERHATPSVIAEDMVPLLQALDEAIAHGAFLQLAWAVRSGHVSERFDVSDVIREWQLTPTAAKELRVWVQYELPRFDGKPLPCVTDATTGYLYRTPDSAWEKLFTTTAAIWGSAVVYGGIVGIFALLNAAGMTTWPTDWGYKLLVLYLFVVGGALAHVAAFSLGNIHFEDRLQIYAAVRGLCWLRLRWLAILRLFIPIAVVTGALWGAGNIPVTFQDLGVAILAGFSADSLLRLSLSRLQAASSSEADAVPKTAVAATDVTGQVVPSA